MTTEGERILQQSAQIAMLDMRVSASENDRAEFKSEIRRSFDIVESKLGEADGKLDRLIARDNQNQGAVRAALVLIGTGVLSSAIVVWRWLENLG